MPAPHDWIYPGNRVAMPRSRTHALVRAIEARGDGLYVHLVPEGSVDPGWFPIAWVAHNCRADATVNNQFRVTAAELHALIDLAAINVGPADEEEWVRVVSNVNHDIEVGGFRIAPWGSARLHCPEWRGGVVVTNAPTQTMRVSFDGAPASLFRVAHVALTDGMRIVLEEADDATEALTPAEVEEFYAQATEPPSEPNLWRPSVGQRFIWGGDDRRGMIYGTIVRANPGTDMIQIMVEGETMEIDRGTLMDNVVTWVHDDVYIPARWLEPGVELALRSDTTSEPVGYIQEVWAVAQGMEPLVRVSRLHSEEQLILRGGEVQTFYVPTGAAVATDGQTTLADAARQAIEDLPQAMGNFVEGINRNVIGPMQQLGAAIVGIAAQAGDYLAWDGTGARWVPSSPNAIPPTLSSRREPERRKTAYEHLLDEGVDE